MILNYRRRMSLLLLLPGLAFMPILLCRWDRRHDTKLEAAHFFRHRSSTGTKKQYPNSPGQTPGGSSPRAGVVGQKQVAEQHRGVDKSNPVAAALGKVCGCMQSSTPFAFLLVRSHDSARCIKKQYPSAHRTPRGPNPHEGEWDKSRLLSSTEEGIRANLWLLPLEHKQRPSQLLHVDSEADFKAYTQLSAALCCAVARQTKAMS